MESISVFGLGKLGSSMLACMAHKGFKVIGVDINEKYVEAIKAGKSPVQEDRVEEYIRDNKDSIEATTDVTYAIQNTNVSFIIVPTPSTIDGTFTTEYIERVLEGIAEALKIKDTYHLIVVTSTVLPGDMNRLKILLEKKSEKACYVDTFGLCYNPEFIALGDVVKGTLNPDMVLIGQCDDKAGEMLENIQRQLVDNEPVFKRMGYHNAELTKIAINSFLSLKIAFASGISDLCEGMPEGDAKVVLEAIGSDTRINPKYIMPGLPPSGPCIPRDAKALAGTAHRFSSEFNLIEVVDYTHRYAKNNLVRKIIYETRRIEARMVSILGMSYKINTPVVEESFGVYLASRLARMNITVHIYDPMAMENACRELWEEIEDGYVIPKKSIKECLEGSSLCFIATPWECFKVLKTDDFIMDMLRPNVIDAWGILNVDNPVNIKRLGTNVG